MMLSGWSKKIQLRGFTLLPQSDKRYLVCLGQTFFVFKKQPTNYFSFSDEDGNETVVSVNTEISSPQKGNGLTFEIIMDVEKAAEIKHTGMRSNQSVQPVLSQDLKDLNFIRAYNGSEECQVFELQCSKTEKVYAFECSSNNEMQSWINVIKSNRTKRLEKVEEARSKKLEADMPEYVLLYEKKKDNDGCVVMLQEIVDDLYPLRIVSLPSLDEVQSPSRKSESESEESTEPASLVGQAIQEHLNLSNYLVYFLEESVADIDAFSHLSRSTITPEESIQNERVRGDLLKLLVETINNALIKRFAYFLTGTSKDESDVTVNTKLNKIVVKDLTLSSVIQAKGGLSDLYSLICWLSHHQDRVRKIYLPGASKEVSANLVQSELFDLLSVLVERYVNGNQFTSDGKGTKGSATVNEVAITTINKYGYEGDGAAAILEEHCVKVWESITKDIADAIVQNEDGTFHTQGPVTVWIALHRHAYLATQSSLPLLQVMVADRIADALKTLLSTMTTFVQLGDQAVVTAAASKKTTTTSLDELVQQNSAAKEVELEFLCALINDIGLHIDEVMVLVSSFKEWPGVFSHVESIFSSVTQSLLKCGTLALKRLVRLIMKDVDAQYHEIFSTDWASTSSNQIDVILYTFNDYLSDFKDFLVQFWFDKFRYVLLNQVTDLYLQAIINRQNKRPFGGTLLSLFGNKNSASSVNGRERSSSEMNNNLKTCVMSAEVLDKIQADLNTINRFLTKIVGVEQTSEHLNLCNEFVACMVMPVAKYEERLQQYSQVMSEKREMVCLQKFMEEAMNVRSTHEFSVQARQGILNKLSKMASEYIPSPKAENTTPALLSKYSILRRMVFLFAYTNPLSFDKACNTETEMGLLANTQPLANLSEFYVFTSAISMMKGSDESKDNSKSNSEEKSAFSLSSMLNIIKVDSTSAYKSGNNGNSSRRRSSLRRNNKTNNNGGNGNKNGTNSALALDDDLWSSIKAHETNLTQSMQAQGAATQQMVERLKNKISLEDTLYKKSAKHTLWQTRFVKLSTRILYSKDSKEVEEGDEAADVTLQHGLMWYKKQGGAVVQSVDMQHLVKVVLVESPRALLYFPDDDAVIMESSDSKAAGIPVKAQRMEDNRDFIIRLCTGGSKEMIASDDIDFKADTVDTIIKWLNGFSTAAQLSYDAEKGEWNRRARDVLSTTVDKWQQSSSQMQQEKAALSLINQTKQQMRSSPSSQKNNPSAAAGDTKSTTTSSAISAKNMSDLAAPRYTLDAASLIKQAKRESAAKRRESDGSSASTSFVNLDVNKGSPVTASPSTTMPRLGSDQQSPLSTNATMEEAEKDTGMTKRGSLSSLYRKSLKQMSLSSGSTTATSTNGRRKKSLAIDVQHNPMTSPVNINSSNPVNTLGRSQSADTSGTPSHLFPPSSPSPRNSLHRKKIKSESELEDAAITNEQNAFNPPKPTQTRDDSDLNASSLANGGSMNLSLKLPNELNNNMSPLRLGPNVAGQDVPSLSLYGNSAPNHNNMYSSENDDWEVASVDSQTTAGTASQSAPATPRSSLSSRSSMSSKGGIRKSVSFSNNEVLEYDKYSSPHETTGGFYDVKSVPVDRRLSDMSSFDNSADNAYLNGKSARCMDFCVVS